MSNASRIPSPARRRQPVYASARENESNSFPRDVISHRDIRENEDILKGHKATGKLTCHRCLSLLRIRLKSKQKLPCLLILLVISIVIASKILIMTPSSNVPQYFPRQLFIETTDQTTYTKQIRHTSTIAHYFKQAPHPSSNRTIPLTEHDIKMKKRLLNSKAYKYAAADPIVTDECIPQHSWQLTSFPNCNTMHEIVLLPPSSPPPHHRIVNNGYHRDVWRITDVISPIKPNTTNTTTTARAGRLLLALKNQRYGHEYTDRNYDRHRRDAVAMERLTKSPFVVTIYGFCAGMSVSEYSEGGDIAVAVWGWNERTEGTAARAAMTKRERLFVAFQVANGVADMHGVGVEEGGGGRASIAHTDITLSQFILIDGIFKVNDFNRCRFMRWYREKTEGGERRPCGFYVGKNRGAFRAPEEYTYDEEDEKVDVYSMGNIFYVLLTERWPFENIGFEEAQKKVMNGERPYVDESLRQSTHPVDVALLKAMEMCHIHNPKERASAREVSDYLMEVVNLEVDKKS